jgi:hypothetical protein
MKLTPGINFTYILRAAFTFEDPKFAKIQSSHQYLFALLGSPHVKAVCKMLMKLTPGLSFAKNYKAKLRIKT